MHTPNEVHDGEAAQWQLFPQQKNAGDVTQRFAEHDLHALTDAELIALVEHAQPGPENVFEAEERLHDTRDLNDCVRHSPRLRAAMELCSRALREELSRKALTSPGDASAFLRAALTGKDYEVFGVLFLDNRNQIIAFEEMFRGSVAGASVQDREVVRAALLHNAAAVIFAHNHPSGVADPSFADRSLTKRLRDALRLVGVRVLDHVVVGAGTSTSMAERGMI
ncbi:MAG TPA: DNA repair protein RadC [Rhodanobacteraceae bacterium]